MSHKNFESSAPKVTKLDVTFLPNGTKTASMAKYVNCSESKELIPFKVPKKPDREFHCKFAKQWTYPLPLEKVVSEKPRAFNVKDSSLNFRAREGRARSEEENTEQEDRVWQSKVNLKCA
uniref:TPX2_importin domain-containing protein n=1 Tax=Steinernema glaseri TaxID=37863 RepID=A0A1I7Y6W1_9BILA